MLWLVRYDDDAARVSEFKICAYMKHQANANL